jgi:hypothetical protein
VTYTAVIKFAPLTTLERVNDPRWSGARAMYDAGGLRLLPGHDSAPLLANHDRAIGTVDRLMLFEDVDGPWLTAITTVADRPAWLKRGARASFAFKAAHTNPDFFGCTVVHRGLLTEVSVLSPDREAVESAACVLSLRPAEQPAEEKKVFYGGLVIRRTFPAKFTVR